MSVASPGVAVRRGHQTGAIAVIGVELARVSIEAKSKSAEAPVPKAAAKMAKDCSKMPAVTAAHRISVTSEAASTKAMSAPPKLPLPRANAAGVPDVIVAVQTENAVASAIIILRMGSLFVSEPMRAPRMRSRNAAIYSWAVRDLFYLFILVLCQPP
jgi:hypothetical protein